MSTTTHSEQVVNHQSKSSKAQARLAWLLISPTVLVLTIVILIPIAQSLYQSLFGRPRLEDDGFFSTTEPFVGLKNYTDIFSSAGERFWVAFYNTMKGRGIVRASILVPWAIPTAVSAILWGWIFNQNGVANAILGQHVMWASGDLSAKMAIIIADVWKTAPYIGLLTLAGLQLIPDEVYEAAKIDGASAWKRFTSITLPLVKPALVVAVVFRALDALRMFDLPYILIGPRKGSVETLSMLVQDESSNSRYGSAAAYALILFLYVFVFAVAFLKITNTDISGNDEARRKRNERKLPVSAFFKRSGSSTPASQTATERSQQA